MKCHIEKINNDNRRPGMPVDGWLVRYNPSDYGWLSTKICSSITAAKDFADELNSGLKIGSEEKN